MSEIDAQLARIRHKLERCRAERPGAFGSEGHGYELGPPLPEAKVRAFEIEHGVTLPEAYRAFITSIGHSGPGSSGGAGPYYGLFALDAGGEFLDWIADGPVPGWLSRPSPLRPGRNEVPEWEDVDDEDWPPEELLSMYGGVLTIGTRGCTYMTGLVVTGEARGRVVYLDAQHSAPYVVRDADFLDWYERWLDEQLAGYQGSWFGYGPAGGERELLEIIATTRDEELRNEALNNLLKVPELSNAVWDALQPRLTSSSARIRETVTHLFARSGPQYADLVAVNLHDPDPNVRRAACRTVMALAAADYEGEVWRTLRDDSDEQVRIDAYFAFKNAELLDEPRLLELVADDSAGVIRGYAAQQISWQSEHEQLLIDMLQADEVSVRREAVNALVRIESTGCADVALELFAREEDSYNRAALIRLFVKIGDWRITEPLLEQARTGNDFERLEAVGALAELGDDRVEPVMLELLALDRTPSAPGRGHSRKFPELVRERLEKSPSPKLRALGKVV